MPEPTTRSRDPVRERFDAGLLALLRTPPEKPRKRKPKAKKPAKPKR